MRRTERVYAAGWNVSDDGSRRQINAPVVCGGQRNGKAAGLMVNH